MIKTIVLLLVTALPALCQTTKPVSWGQITDGVRFGVGLGPGETLRLLFQNTAAVETDLLLGGLTGIGPIYTMEYTARGPDGKACKLFPGGVGHVAGHLEPIVVRLAAGGTHELLLPLKRFVCVINKENVTLEHLLRQKHSILALLEVTAESARWSRSKKPWTGRVVSGDFVTKPASP